MIVSLCRAAYDYCAFPCHLAHQLLPYLVVHVRVYYDVLKHNIIIIMDGTFVQ